MTEDEIKRLRPSWRSAIKAWLHPTNEQIRVLTPWRFIGRLYITGALVFCIFWAGSANWIYAH